MPTQMPDFNVKHVDQPDEPTASAQEMKELFDARGNEIREYLNNTLVPELTGYGVNYAESSAGTDDYAVTITNFPEAYAAGQRVVFKADVANTGACTLKVNELAAVAIKLDDGSDPADGDIQAGAVVTVVYNGTNWQLVSSSGSVLKSHLADMTAHGVNTKVSKSGDSMSGDLDIFKSNPKIELRHGATGNVTDSVISATNNSQEIWRIGGPSGSGHLNIRTLTGGNIIFTASRLGFNSIDIIVGSGSPEGVMTAPVGSIYLRTDGGASTTFYVKESGTGNTGWKAVQTA